MIHKTHQRHDHEMTARCSCGCGTQVLLQLLSDGQMMIDARADGRYRWTGVVLNKEESERIIRFLTVRAFQDDCSSL